MDIKQLKINGVAFYPKVPVEAIVSVDGDTGAVDTTVQQNSDNLVTSGAVYTAIQGKSTTWTDVQGKPNFATVAISGSYNDLTDKPTIPSVMSVDDVLNANSTNPVQNKVVNGAIGGLQQSISGVSSQLNNKLSSGDLKTVNGQSLVGSGDITITPGSDVTVDDALNTSSTNPVQNKIVAGEIANLQYQITETADDLFNYYYTKTSTDDLLAAKQASLVSGTNIKTINNQSILGSGDITISSGGSIAVDSALSTTSTNPVQNKIITNELYDVAEDVQELFGAVYNSGNNRIDTLESNKQDKLVSGTNIKTINGQTILGNGDITISTGDGGTTYIENPYDITTALGYTTSGTNYAVQIASGKLYVNVPTSTGGISLVKSITLDDNGSALLAGEGSIYLQGLDGIKTKFNNNVISLYLEDQFKVDMQSALETAAQSLNDVGDLEERVAALEAIEPGDGGTSPSIYLKSITKNGNTYTIKDQTNTETSWTIGGGSGSINSVSYSNNAGDFAPDANGKVTLVIDQTLNEDSGRPVTNAATALAIKNKQDRLVSGTNIKTINGNDLLGSGNIEIGSGDENVIETIKVNGTALTPDSNKAVDITVPNLNISTATPTNGQVLKWNGTQWAPATDNTSEGGGSITVDNALSNTSENPVLNKVIASEISSLSSGINSVSMNKQNKLVSGTNIKTINNQSLLGSGNWDSSIELVDHAVDGVTQKTVQYTKLGDSQATTLFDIDYKVKLGSWNPVASYAVYSAIGDKFTSLNTKYSQGVDLTGVVNYISHSETVVGSDLRGVTSMSMTITWFNACGDSGLSERLNKKTHTFDRVAMNFDGAQWDPQLMIDELNNQNSTDFLIQGRPIFTFTEESSGRYAISMLLGLSSAKYQVYSISDIKFYYAENELPQAAPPSTSIEYSYTYSSIKDGIYVDKSHNAILVCINNYWYKLADLEEFPIQPND